MHIDHPSCDAFWSAYLAQLAPDHPHRAARPDRFGFGGEPALADELAALVLAGRKCATTSLPVEYTSLAEPLPRAGDLSIIVRGDGTPAAIIERLEVVSRPFDEVDERYAAIEGEGDGSLAYWREAHTAYFTGVCQQHGESFGPRTEVLCQIFCIVFASKPD